MTACYLFIASRHSSQIFSPTAGHPRTRQTALSPLAVFPSGIYLDWTNSSADGFMAETMRLSHASLVEAGIKDGQDLGNPVPYVNYALFGTSIYGEHLERLREIRKKYDTDGVMGLAGGWNSRCLI